jgi:hypothetical protein
MASGMTSTAKRQECIFVAQILASLRHMMDVISSEATNSTEWIQCEVFLLCLPVYRKLFSVSFRNLIHRLL